MPWDELESAAEVSFDDTRRRDIFREFESYESDLAVYEQAVAIAKVEKLRKDLLERLEGLIGLHCSFYGSDDNDALFSALCWERGDDLRAKMSDACDAISEVVVTLRRESDGHAIMENFNKPVSVAFRNFLGKLWACPKDKDQSRLEWWGLAPTGRSSPRTISFLERLLERKVQPNDLNTARQMNTRSSSG